MESIRINGCSPIAAVGGRALKSLADPAEVTGSSSCPASAEFRGSRDECRKLFFSSAQRSFALVQNAGGVPCCRPPRGRSPGFELPPDRFRCALGRGQDRSQDPDRRRSGTLCARRLASTSPCRATRWRSAEFRSGGHAAAGSGLAARPAALRCDAARYRMARALFGKPSSWCPDLKVLFMSGPSTRNRRYPRSVPPDFLQKPFRLDVLARRVRSLIDRRSAHCPQYPEVCVRARTSATIAARLLVGSYFNAESAVTRPCLGRGYPRRRVTPSPPSPSGAANPSMPCGSWSPRFAFMPSAIASIASSSRPKFSLLDSRRATPAERLDNGRDFVPTNKWVVFGHHFAAIAGPGPLVGPVLAAQFGYLPGTLWILVGAVLGGCVQDFVTLVFSVRRDGKSLTEMAREEIGKVGGVVGFIAVVAIIVILLGAVALIVVNALKGSPWGTFTIGMTIPIALLMGVYLRRIRPGKVMEASALGFRRSCWRRSSAANGSRTPPTRIGSRSPRPPWRSRSSSTASPPRRFRCGCCLRRATT